MSRLDSFIRRLQAQRACLGLAVGLTRQIEGPFVEMGLGNGRTYDHLRELAPEREIIVFERQVAAHPDCIPDGDRLVLGDIYETLPRNAERLGHRVALVHVDIGCGDEATTLRISAFIAGYLPQLLVPGGVVISDQDVRFPGSELLAMPEGVAPGRYHLYRMS